jgi:hypothetical protein
VSGRGRNGISNVSRSGQSANPKKIGATFGVNRHLRQNVNATYLKRNGMPSVMRRSTHGNNNALTTIRIGMIAFTAARVPSIKETIEIIDRT